MTRKAFLVGINRYPDPRSNLKGCVNDVLLMAATLRERYGFTGASDVKLLTDERATTANIRKGLEWLVGDSSAGDSLVFHYSGHGAQVRDLHGDELSDNLDEIICPYDLDWNPSFYGRRPGEYLQGSPQRNPVHRHSRLLPLRHGSPRIPSARPADPL